MEKIIEDLIKRLNNLEERLNMLENKSYGSDTVFVDSILKYNVIRVNFDADSKHIESWVGFDTIDDAAFYCGMKKSSVKASCKHVFKIQEWATYTFFYSKEFNDEYYMKGKQFIDEKLFLEGR